MVTLDKISVGPKARPEVLADRLESLLVISEPIDLTKYIATPPKCSRAHRSRRLQLSFKDKECRRRAKENQRKAVKKPSAHSN
jgi:hypothetical protein